MVKIDVPEPSGTTITLANRCKPLESGWSGEILHVPGMGDFIFLSISDHPACPKGHSNSTHCKMWIHAQNPSASHRQASARHSPGFQWPSRSKSRFPSPFPLPRIGIFRLPPHQPALLSSEKGKAWQRQCLAKDSRVVQSAPCATYGCGTVFATAVQTLILLCLRTRKWSPPLPCNKQSSSDCSPPPMIAVGGRGRRSGEPHKTKSLRIISNTPFLAP